MMIAQKLYEGIELGSEGSVGLITYMRTDSTRVSDDALADVRSYIGSSFGADYLPEKPVFYRSKKDAQDAHEAIRPTSTAYNPDEIKHYLGPDEYKLYKLIWQRFVASQMKPALFDQTSVEILAEKYMFKATGSVLKFDGFLKVYAEGKDEKDEEDEELEHKLPVLTEGEILRLNKLLPEQHFTQPPAALHRSHAGEDAGRERHRPAIDLRHDSDDDSGPRIRGEAGRQVLSHRTGLRDQ